jgi:hypothetical protein
MLLPHITEIILIPATTDAHWPFLSLEAPIVAVHHWHIALLAHNAYAAI